MIFSMQRMTTSGVVEGEFNAISVWSTPDELPHQTNALSGYWAPQEDMSTFPFTLDGVSPIMCLHLGSAAALLSSIRWGKRPARKTRGSWQRSCSIQRSARPRTWLGIECRHGVSGLRHA